MLNRLLLINGLSAHTIYWRLMLPKWQNPKGVSGTQNKEMADKIRNKC